MGRPWTVRARPTSRPMTIETLRGRSMNGRSTVHGRSESSMGTVWTFQGQSHGLVHDHGGSGLDHSTVHGSVHRLPMELLNRS